MTDIADLLGVKEIPSYDEAVSDKSKLLALASALYRVDQGEIKTIEEDENFKYFGKIKKFDITIGNGSTDSFYLKENKGTSLRQALGLAISSIIDKKHNQWVANKDTIATTKIDGQHLHTVKDVDVKKYANAVEVANALGLNDREGVNVIAKDDGTIVNIDYETVSNVSTPYMNLSNTIHVDEKDLVMKRHEARIEMGMKYEENIDTINAMVDTAKKCGVADELKEHGADINKVVDEVGRYLMGEDLSYKREVARQPKSNLGVIGSMGFF